MRRLKTIIKFLTPPIIFSFYSTIRNSRYGWSGNYNSWEDAQDAASGYDSDIILQTVHQSLLKVKNGESIYERDSVLFDKIQYNWPLLSGLMYAASKSNGSLHIMDFGGSLGSTYFQNKKFLDRLNNVKWGIVEQAHFVEVGQKDFEDSVLKFYSDIEICLTDLRPNVLLLSSVLQYIESPYELLEKLFNYNFSLVIVDRTPFVKDGRDTIKLQRVNPTIYDASYPCWFFDEKKFLKFFEEKNYKKLESFEALDGLGVDYYFSGYFFET